MGLIAVNLAVTSLFVWWCFVQAKTRRGMLQITGVSLAFSLVFGMFCMSIALVLQGLATFVLAVIALPFAPNKMLFKSALVIAPIVIYGWAISMTLSEYRELKSLQHDFPLVSIADRLSYEQTMATSKNANSSRKELALEIEKQLSDRERSSGTDTRSRTLLLVHSQNRDQFVLARGFGPVRIMSIHKHRIELPDVPPIPFDPSPTRNPPRYRPNGSAIQDDQPQASYPPVSRENLAKLYEESFDDFLEPARMGFIQDPQHVAGFVPHRFFRMPGTEGEPWKPRYDPDDVPSSTGKPPRSDWRKNWAITRLELIGTPRHDKPLAYVSEHLPQLEELSKYPTRDLTNFEQSALIRLQDLEDVVIESQPARILMLGSLRANDNCRRCHTVPRGELLGALSYELQPD